MTSKSSIVRTKKKLEILKKKEICVPNEINWEWLGQVGLVEDMTPYLVKMFVHNGDSITCDGRRRLFRMQEPVYQELCWEFFSTISFSEDNEFYNPNVLSFFLSGEVRHCSIAELG